MINSRSHKKNGFTIAELMIAIFIIATSLGALFGLQNAVFRRIGQAYLRVTRVFISKKMLMDEVTSEAERVTPLEEEEIADPRTTLKFIGKKVSDDSVFKKFPDMYLLRVESEWPTLTGQRKENLVAFIYKPKPPKEEGAEPSISQQESSTQGQEGVQVTSNKRGER